MPSYEFRIVLKGQARNVEAVEAIKEMVQRQTNEVLANTRLLYQGSDNPPKVELELSIAHTRFTKVPFIGVLPEAEPERDGMGNRVDGEGEVKKENPFETM